MRLLLTAAGTGTAFGYAQAKAKWFPDVVLLSGDYFCICDGDDYYVNDHFAAQAIETMDNNPAVNSVVFDFEYRRTDKTYRSILRQFQEGEIRDRNNFIRKYYVHAGAYVFRNCLSMSQMDKLLSCPLLIDNVIVPFFVHYGGLYYIPQISYSYRVEGGSWSSKTKEEKAFYFDDTSYFKKIAPQFAWDSVARRRNDLDYAFQIRKKIGAAIEEHSFAYYQHIAKKYKNRLLLSLLQWDNLSWRNKLYVIFSKKYIDIALFLERIIYTCGVFFSPPVNGVESIKTDKKPVNRMGKQTNSLKTWYKKRLCLILFIGISLLYLFPGIAYVLNKKRILQKINKKIDKYF